MKVTEKKLDGGKVLLEAAASPAEVGHAFTLAQYAFAQQMGIQPKPGQSVAQAVEQQAGIKDLDNMVRSQVADFLAPFALDKRNLVPAFPAKPVYSEEPKRGAAFEFTMTVTPKPEYELTSYEPVSITIPSMEIAEAEIDQQIAYMAESYAEFITDEPRPVAAGDSLLLALEASVDGKSLEGLNTDGRTLVLGMGLMPPSFEEQIIGMQPGETKEFSFDAPTLPGETPDKIDAKVTVKEIQKKVLPTIDDEWVTKNMPLYPNLAALRQGIADTMMMSMKPQYEQLKAQVAAAELGKRFQGKIEDAVYEAMRDTLVASMQAQVAAQGMSFDQFVASQGGEQQFSMMLMLQTREMLVQGYALDAVFRHEKLTTTDDDILAVCATMSPQDPQAIKRQMDEEGRGFALREMAERNKANQWVVDHAHITIENAPSADAEPKEVQQAEENIAREAVAGMAEELEAAEKDAE
ncbi:trigger factor [Adlercreutzia agrestimuris]|uniref:trigger factor n=1 Tax=Adlercreutzia agrestimuris TaxID=2941324 RepID=UPI00203EC87F|nr:trigger factor [Adlercreutzia agrestimuris]